MLKMDIFFIISNILAFKTLPDISFGFFLLTKTGTVILWLKVFSPNNPYTFRHNN